MRSLFFTILGLFQRLRRWWLGLRGQTEADIHARRMVEGTAWAAFCEQLKTAGAALVYPGAPRDAFQQAEGVRYLTRLTRAALEAFVEYNDPAFPVLRRMVHETVKMGADNPDNYYQNAQISGNYEYRIRGRRNDVHYLGFFTQNGNYGTTGGLAPCDVLEHTDLEIDADGRFEIILSREPRGKNWLKVEPETTLLMVRQTFLHRDRETPADLHIAAIGGPPAPAPLTPQQVDHGLQTAGLFVAGAALLFARWARGFQAHTNRLPLFDPAVSNAAGGDAHIVYYHSHWRLSEEEILLIEVTPPPCDTWNFQLNNYWMESLDYRYFDICLSRGNAHYEADGSVRIYVSHHDPGHPNWIRTCGHREGTMCWRWYRLEEGVAPPEEVPCRIVVIDGQG